MTRRGAVATALAITTALGLLFSLAPAQGQTGIGPVDSLLTTTTLPPLTLPPVPPVTVPPVGAPPTTAAPGSPSGGGAPADGSSPSGDPAAGGAQGGQPPPGSPAAEPPTRAPEVSRLATALSGSTANLALGASAIAGSDIPPDMLRLYNLAAPTCPGLSWTVLAAVGKAETDHARAVAVSTAGALGPMQFIQSTWDAFKVDANLDGNADVQDKTDSVFGAAKYLCWNGAGDPAHLYSAIFAYNHADWYVNMVLSYAAQYAAIPAFSSTAAVGAFAIPVDALVLAADPAAMTKPHHDYPAWDLPMPEGTTIYAVTTGVVQPVGGGCGNGIVISDLEGFRYQYCHGSELLVTPGSEVSPGQPIMRSGNTGNSTGPHLHLGIYDPKGTQLCPQALVQAWYAGIPSQTGTAPTTGCSYGGGASASS